MSSILRLVRHAVSGSKKRFVEDGFDLDLTYITPNIVAMGFPASNFESTYRNKLSDVARLMRTRHNGHFMIWNLSERPYNYDKLDNQVLDFGFPDHTAPPMELLFKIVRSIDSWMSADRKNICVVHCLAGLGRTGTVICSYMLYAKLMETASSALQFFADMRTRSGRGVRIPSQIRYVHYFERAVRGVVKPEPVQVMIRKIMVQPVPICSGGTFAPVIQVWDTVTQRLLSCNVSVSRPITSFTDADDVAVIELDAVVAGDITIKCFHAGASLVGGERKQSPVFRIMFHTAFEGSLLRCTKDTLDWAHKDKSFSDEVVVDVIIARNVTASPVADADRVCWNELTMKLVEASPDERDIEDDDEDDNYNDDDAGDGDRAPGSNPGASSAADAAGTSARGPSSASSKSTLSSQSGAAAAAAMGAAAATGPSPGNSAPASSASSLSASSGGARTRPMSVNIRAPTESLVAAPPARRRLHEVVLHHLPNFAVGGGCWPCMQIWRDNVLIFSSQTDRRYTQSDAFVKFVCDVVVEGHVTFRFFDVSGTAATDSSSSWVQMFQFALLSSQLGGDVVRLTRAQLSFLRKDEARIPEDMFLDIGAGNA